MRPSDNFRQTVQDRLQHVCWQDVVNLQNNAIHLTPQELNSIVRTGLDRLGLQLTIIIIDSSAN